MIKHTGALIVLLALTAAAVAQSGGGAPSSGGPGTGRAEDVGRNDNMDLPGQPGFHGAANASAQSEVAAGAALVKAQQFAAALPRLDAALAKEPRNLQALIYAGFAHRMIGGNATGESRTAEFNKALDAYRRALAIDPDNRLVHEYLGKLYLLMRDPSSLRNELEILARLCPEGCVERTALVNAAVANPL